MHNNTNKRTKLRLWRLIFLNSLLKRVLVASDFVSDYNKDPFHSERAAKITTTELERIKSCYKVTNNNELT